MPVVVVMGVSGSGKTTVGRLMAAELSVPFVDADDLHSAEAVEHMASGRPLDDDQRLPWLQRVGEHLAAHQEKGLVMACSALKRNYRDLLRRTGPSDVFFVHLNGSREVLLERMLAREHFMPPALLDSQLETLEALEPDENGATVDIAGLPEDVVATSLRSINAATQKGVSGPQYRQ